MAWLRLAGFVFAGFVLDASTLSPIYSQRNSGVSLKSSRKTGSAFEGGLMVIEAMAKQATMAVVRHRGRSRWLKVVMRDGSEGSVTTQVYLFCGFVW